MALTKVATRMISGNPLYLRDFGAVGDGVTDDTAAIQAAVDEAGLPSVSWLLGSPDDTYKITAPITIGDPSTAGYLNFDGQGCGFKVMGDVSGFVFDAGVSQFKNCSITAYDLVSGSGLNPATATNSAIKGDVQGYFQNVRATYFNTGFDFETNSFLLTIDNCTAYNCVTGFSNASTTQSATTTVLDRCYALACTTGYFLDGISDGEMRNCACDIGGGDFSLATTVAVSTRYISGFTISSMHIEGEPSSDYVCFAHIDPGAVTHINTRFDIYENSFSTVLFSLLGSPTNTGGSVITIMGSSQSLKSTQPATVRYRLRTDAAAENLFVNSINNAWITTNQTERVGNFGSGNVGNCLVLENSTPSGIPVLYKLSGSNSGVIQYPSAIGLAITDGVTAPATASGLAQIYVDTADGDLKVKFGDGTVKTIVTDT